MATYPIKMLKDETGTPFVPLINTKAIVDPDGSTLADKLEHKLEIGDMIAGDDIVIATDAETDAVTISAVIPEIIDSLESTSNTATLSANQGREIALWIESLVSANAQEHTTLQVNIDTKATKANSLSGYGILDAYTKEEVDTKVSSIYRYVGSVATESDLPTEGMVIGDVYDVRDTDMNVVWNGIEWDKLGSTVDLSPYITAEQISSLYVTKNALESNLSAINTILDTKLITSNIKAGSNIVITTNGNDCTIEAIMPVKGVDYWNDEDKAEIEAYCKAYIDEHITDAIGGSY